jgi:hypothetical protein
MSLEEALTTPHNELKSTAIECVDHEGNTFPSKVAMCDYWRIPRTTYFRRIRDGWTLEKALTTPVISHCAKKKICDHKNNEFDSIDSMCAYWNISKQQYIINIRNNCSIEDALTTATEWTECRDHLGHKYDSINDMCRHYGISKTMLRSRLELGWTLEQILENPNKIDNSKKVKDHLGNQYSTQKEMLQHYGIYDATFRHRQNRGCTLEECLSDNIHKVRCKDHLGNEFDTIQDMCTYWNVSTTSYHHRVSIGWDIKKILTTVSKEKAKSFGPDLTVIKQIESDYYEVEFKQHKYIWSEDQLWGYYHKHNLEK